MATIVNDRDVLLQATSPRYATPIDRAMILSASAPVFKVASGGVGSPSSVTFTPTLLNISGTVSYTMSAGIALTYVGNVATLTFANMTAVSGSVTASLTVDSVTYTQTQTISKVVDGTNNKDSSIREPVGGIYNTTVADVTGSLKIRLPVSWPDTMIKLTVDIFEYSTGLSCTLDIAGYPYSGTSAWINCSAKVIGGSNVEYPVYFGHDGTKCCIWIGIATERWAYPQVRVRDVLLGYSNVTAAVWESGWAISFDTVGAINVTQTIADTYPAADWRKVVGLGRPANNATVGATFGVDIGGQAASSNIADSAIQTAHLGGSQVTTSTIANNAVVIPVSSYTAAGISIIGTTTVQTVQTASITSTGAPIAVFASASFAADTSTVTIQILRDATVIYSASVGTSGVGVIVPFSTCISDTTTAGVHTYYIKFRDCNNASAINRSLVLLETKR